jgi:hypothetical protein
MLRLFVRVRGIEEIMAKITNFPSRQQMWDCVSVCSDTQRSCLDTVRYCLDMGGRFSASGRIRVLLDCASMCQTTAEDSRHGSILYEQSASYCAHLCERVARELYPLAADDMIQACILACQRCAEYCQGIGMQKAA